MRYITVAAIALNQTPLDWDHNQANILAGLKKAREQGAEIVCFPELCITGYGCEDAFLSVANCKTAFAILLDIAKETKGIIAAVGLPILFRDGLYNTCGLLVDGKIAGFVAKQHLPGYSVHYEPRWFKPWPSGIQTEFEYCGEQYRLGDLIFNINDLLLGFEICEDAWVANRTGICLANRGVDVILNPSASHFAFGKSAVRRRFVMEGARAFGVAYVYANLLGNEAGRIIYDGDTIIAAGEKLVSVGPRFSFKDNVVTSSVIDIQDLRLTRSKYIDSCIASNPDGTISCEFKHVWSKTFPKHKISAENSSIISTAWEEGKDVKYQEFARAVSLGLFDYLRKSRQRGYVLNLSGGADSGATACLVYLMIRLCLEELGFEKLQEKLHYIPEIKNIKTKRHQGEEPIKVADIMPILLYCLYQASENSGKVTLDAAKSLAEALHAPFANLDIRPIIKAYYELIEPLVNRKLEWQTDDIALQNIQSRVRGPSAWFLANLRHAILLCTSNRSEASVGYTTIDGDTCGGLSPIAGVDKSFILQWLKWLQRIGIEGIGPIPCLDKITLQNPTAELRPSDHPQTDEADLMSFEWLDTIERLFVRDKRSPEEILIAMQRKYSEATSAELKAAIDKFCKLWAANQWKRERIAPSFHLDDESVDPKTWCRYPILSGGFQKELKTLSKDK